MSGGVLIEQYYEKVRRFHLFLSVWLCLLEGGKEVGG